MITKFQLKDESFRNTDKKVYQEKLTRVRYYLIAERLLKRLVGMRCQPDVVIRVKNRLQAFLQEIFADEMAKAMKVFLNVWMNLRWDDDTKIGALSNFWE